MKQNNLLFKSGAFELNCESEISTFSGIAYSGEAITNHYYWDNVVFDLDSMTIETPTAVLLEHDSLKRLGVVKQFALSHEKGLEVSGDFLQNELAELVASDSKSGFPFEMSVYIVPSSVEKVEKGEVTVNGRVFKAPINIFRGGVIREVSFCALGADSNTTAIAASDNSNVIKEDSTMTELEQAKAEIAELKTQLEAAKEQSKTSQDELQEFKAAKRNDDIQSLSDELKLSFSDDEKQSYANMSDEAFAFSTTQLRKHAKKELPKHLFSQQFGSEQQPTQSTKSLVEQAKARAGV